MRWTDWGLRMQVAAALAAACIGIAALIGLLLYKASEDLEDVLIDQIVGEELEALIHRAARGEFAGAQSGPNLEYYVVRAGDRARLPQSLRTLSAGQHSIGSGEEERRIGVRDVGDMRYIVAYDAGAHALRERSFKVSLVLSIAAGALAALALGYWIAGVLTRSLTELAREVSALDPHRSHPSLARSGQQREVAILADALDRHHARFAELIRREQEFTADVSHELRTPLTTIRTSCELLAAEAALSEKGRLRLAAAAAAAEQMTERGETLLELARPDPPADREAVSLLASVRQAAEACSDEIARKGLRFELRIGEEASVRVERKALQVVIANLVRNAVQYTERGAVRVTFDGLRLTVADTGPGISDSQLPHVFDRYYRADTRPDGVGLGLAIVKRICEDCGWTIEAKSTLGAGSEFTLVLPAQKTAAAGR